MFRDPVAVRIRVGGGTWAVEFPRIVEADAEGLHGVHDSVFDEVAIARIHKFVSLDGSVQSADFNMDHPLYVTLTNIASAQQVNVTEFMGGIKQ